MINMYSKCGEPQKALSVWESMLSHNITPNSVTFLCVFMACSKLGNAYGLQIGTHAHQLMQSNNHKGDLDLSAMIISMYTKCGDYIKALGVWEQLLLQNTNLSYASCVCTLKTCSTMGTPAALTVGKVVHKIVNESTQIKYDLMMANSLIHMYARCGDPSLALKVFEQLPNHKLSADKLSCTSALIACCELAALTPIASIVCDRAQLLIGDSLVDCGEKLEGTLMNFYARCNAVEKAHELFLLLLQKRGQVDARTWNSMISAYANAREIDKVCLHIFYV
jgi:pentatricopeptide repeat protein